MHKYIAARRQWYGVWSSNQPTAFPSAFHSSHRLPQINVIMLRASIRTYAAKDASSPYMKNVGELENRFKSDEYKVIVKTKGWVELYIYTW